MDEVRVVRRRTYVWPVVIAVIILALVIAWAFFSMGGTPTDVGWTSPGTPPAASIGLAQTQRAHVTA